MFEPPPVTPSSEGASMSPPSGPGPLADFDPEPVPGPAPDSTPARAALHQGVVEALNDARTSIVAVHEQNRLLQADNEALRIAFAKLNLACADSILKQSHLEERIALQAGHIAELECQLAAGRDQGTTLAESCLVELKELRLLIECGARRSALVDRVGIDVPRWPRRLGTV